MLRQLQSRNRVVGAKQARRAIRAGLARRVLLAADADTALAESISRQCAQASVPVSRQYTMRELGQAAGIQVGAAVVALL